MRLAKEMEELILAFVKQDERIRAVYLNGSRANPNAVKDSYQDFDLVFVVESCEPYIQDRGWIPYFGDIVIMQEPKPVEEGSYVYLMQFKDGNRIDLTFIEKPHAARHYYEDSLTVLWLDKDHCFLPVNASEANYVVQKPSKEEYEACCNEFWWVATYIAKGLWRDELIYALEHFNYYVRKELIQMLTWKIGFDTQYTSNVGKHGKSLQRFLTKPLWEALLQTYPVGEKEAIWTALIHAMDLFDLVAMEVAKQLDYEYQSEESAQTRNFILRESTSATLS